MRELAPISQFVLEVINDLSISVADANVVATLSGIDALDGKYIDAIKINAFPRTIDAKQLMRPLYISATIIGGIQEIVIGECQTIAILAIPHKWGSGQALSVRIANDNLAAVLPMGIRIRTSYYFSDNVVKHIPAVN